MIDDKIATSMLKAIIDNMTKELGDIWEMPKYLRTEMVYPKKKPRGSIRRAKKESNTNESKSYFL